MPSAPACQPASHGVVVGQAPDRRAAPCCVARSILLVFADRSGLEQVLRRATPITGVLRRGLSGSKELESDPNFPRNCPYRLLKRKPLPGRFPGGLIVG